MHAALLLPASTATASPADTNITLVLYQFCITQPYSAVITQIQTTNAGFPGETLLVFSDFGKATKYHVSNYTMQ